MFFQSLSILLNAALCRVYPLEQMFLHALLLYTYGIAFEAKSSLLSPCVPRSLSFFLPRRFFSLSTLSSFFCVILLIPLTLPSLLDSSVGRLLIEFSSLMTMERVQRENPNVTDGGRYTPPDCRPRWKVCLCVCVCVSVSLWVWERPSVCVCISHALKEVCFLTHFISVYEMS